jgi:hypothetical protein
MVLYGVYFNRQNRPFKKVSSITVPFIPTDDPLTITFEKRGASLTPAEADELALAIKAWMDERNAPRPAAKALSSAATAGSRP